MNKKLLLLVISTGLLCSFASAQVSPGINNSGLVSLESQTISPAGQTDFQTDPFTGRFSYVFPLDVAPARHGSEPNLELLYNSANGNSWCGTGWDIDVGYIERESKYGVPVQWSSGKPVLAYDDTKGFLFSFKNKTSDLVEIATSGSGTAWRAQVQSDFLQFNYYGGTSNTWVVVDKSGNQYFFGSGSGSRMTNPKSGWSTSGDSNTWHWALDTIITATGDKTIITYTSAGGRLYPHVYSYNGSTGGSGITPPCVVTFNLTTTNRPDTTISCRPAYAITNQYLLSSIVHTVSGQMVWSNSLHYTFSPSTGRALLYSITHYGADQSTALPPVTFGYSQQSFTFQTPTTTWTNLYLPSTTSPESEGDPETYYSFNNSFIDLVDMDGDGFPDRIISPYMNPATNIWIQHNNGSNGFANPVPWVIGNQTYQSTKTTNDYSWAAVQGSHGRVIDINGDGLPDFLTDPLESYFNGGLTSAMLTNYGRLVVQFNNSTNLSNPQSSWTNVNNQWSTTDQTTSFRAVENSQYVLMLDMNGDGLPDRVMTQPTYPYTNYFVQFNTGSNFTGTNLFGPWVLQGPTNDFDWGGLTGSAGGTGNQVNLRMLDINGDGLPDRVMLVGNADGTLSASDQTYLVVELNNGYGFEPPINWTNVNPFTTCNGDQVGGISDLGDDAYVAYRDMNGDGLPDRIIACQCTPYDDWYIQFNTGTGFSSTLVSWPANSQGQTSTVAYSGINTMGTNDTGIPIGLAMLLDMNGDGLPDRVEYKYPGPSSDYVVELSSGPYPDLLIAASNGIGGVVTAAYKPSTQINNQQSPGTSPTRYLLPFLYYTVSSVSVSDGIYPVNTTSYSYTGGYWNSILRQFDGFAQTTVVDPLEMTTTHWFHQAGGRNNSASGEYGDSTNTIGKVGMEFRIDTVGSDGNPYKTVLNQVNETVLNSVEHYAFVATNLEIDYPATSSSYKAKATVYYYNQNNGNLTNDTDWGQVTPVSMPPGSEAFTDVTGDSRYRIIQYASLSNTNIIDKPSEITLYDNTGANILRQVNYTYDQNTGNTLQELDAICPGSYRTNTYTYDSYNNTATATDPADIVTQYTYDSTSETFPITTTEGGSFTTSTTYDVRSGKLFSSTDWVGLVVSNRYDALLRLAEKYCSLTPNGSPTEWLDQYTYTLGDSSGPQNSVLHQQSDGVDLSNGHETMTWFDGLGRAIQGRVESESSGEYRTVDTIFDQRGNVEFVCLPYLSSGTSRSTPVTELGAAHGYDPIGRPSQLTEVSTGTFSGGLLSSMSGPVGDTSSPIGTATVTYYYSGDPWTWVVTDANTNTHRYTRDAYGRTNTIVEINGSQTYTTTLNWNLASDLISVTDNVANVIQYSNNLVGEIVAMADPDMGVWKYERDYAGRIRLQTDGDGQTIQYNYSPDPLGRLLSRQVYDLKGNFYYGVTNVYDTNSGDTGFSVYKGQLYETIDSEGFTEYGYDVRGRKTINRRFLSKNGNLYTNQYSYDDMDRVRSIVYPNGGPTITNIYDTGANLSVVEPYGSSSPYYHATAFTALDQIATIQFANNAFSSGYSYYANSKRLSSAQTGSIQNLGYTYTDAVGDIGGITDTAYTGTASAAISGVSYDSLHRLAGFTRNSQSVTFTYDTIGDMLTDTENGSASYVYATTAGTRLPHAVKSANGLNYAYDTTGNMLVRGTEALMYNPENRLIALAVSNQVITFGYDADGNRLWKQSPTNTLQVWVGGNYEEKDGKILYHISAGKRLVYTYSSDGSVAEYYIPDHLRSAEIIVTVTNSVAVAQHYEYTAYGNSRYTLSATSFPITRRYTSQSFDEETGLYYYGNSRYYDPVIGRFIQPDGMIPNFFDPQMYDRYAYARDNPLRYVDPDGHAPSDWADSMQPAIDGYYGGYISDSSHTSVIGLWTAYMGQGIASGYNDMLRLGTGAEEGTVTGFAQDLGRAGGIVLTLAGPADAAATKLAPAEASVPKVAAETAPTSAAKPLLPDEYWKNKQAPTQTTPGTKEVVDMKPSSRSQGETYKRTTYYDEYGRSTGQTHETSHGEPDVHPDPHHHIRDPKTGQQSGPIPGPHPTSTSSQPTPPPAATDIPSDD